MRRGSIDSIGCSDTALSAELSERSEWEFSGTGSDTTSPMTGPYNIDEVVVKSALAPCCLLACRLPVANHNTDDARRGADEAHH
jgi:hypothetical protein